MIRVILTTKHPLMAREITAGHMDIGNDQTGSDRLSHHDVQIFRRSKAGAQQDLLRKGRLENFERGELSYFDLVHQSLNALAGAGFKDASSVQPVLKVSITQIATGSETMKLQGLVRLLRQKGGSDRAARFSIELFAADVSTGEPKVFRSGLLRDFDTTDNGYFDLLSAGLNASVGDGFYRRSLEAGSATP